MHGAGRDPDRYRNEWRALADTNAFILITPGFDKKNFPKSRSYNYGGFRDADGDLRPRDEWTFAAIDPLFRDVRQRRSEEHTSELQPLMRIAYAVFCLKKKHNTKKPLHE